MLNEACEAAESCHTNKAEVKRSTMGIEPHIELKLEGLVLVTLSDTISLTDCSCLLKSVHDADAQLMFNHYVTELSY